MNPYYRLKALTHYPEWHYKPLRLSNAEMQDPWLVMEEFFNMYDLPNVRDILHLWLDDTTDAGSEDLSKHIHTCSMIEKLAEAAFLLHRQKEQEEKEAAGEKQAFIVVPESGDENKKEEYGPDAEEDTDRKPFAKRPFWEKEAGDPVKAISWVFGTEDLDTLKEIIKEWCTTALTNEKANYEEAAQRADLLAFCHKMAKLADAAYCIHRIHAIEKRSGFPLKDPVNLQPEILQKEKTLALSYEELLHPEQVLHQFCQQFALGYITAELWDLLDSVITIESSSTERACLLLHYQCMLVLAQAAWQLYLREETTGIEEHPQLA